MVNEFSLKRQRRLIKKVSSYIWPAISGVMIAAVLLLSQTGKNSNGADQQNPLPKNDGDWIGAASYSAAVRHASPSVANIYTWKTVTC